MRKERKKKKRNTNLSCFGLRPVLIKIGKRVFKLVEKKQYKLARVDYSCR